MKKLTMEDVKQTAKERGFECLSKEYVNSSTKMKWKCKNGHIWMANYKGIRIGKGCPYCSKKVKHTIDDCYDLAKERGFECLSNKYKTVSYTHLTLPTKLEV